MSNEATCGSHDDSFSAQRKPRKTRNRESSGGGAGARRVQWDRWSTDMHLRVTDPAQLARAPRARDDAEPDAVELAASRFRDDSEICALASANGERRAVSRVLWRL